MSRWYDQHRTNKRMRRLEQQAATPYASPAPGWPEKHAAALKRVVGDAVDAREQPPAFPPELVRDDVLRALERTGAAQHE